MRSDIIDEILSVEDHAQQIVKEADEQGREQVIASQTKANELIHQAVQEEREKNRKELDKAEADGQKALDDFTVSLEGQDQMPSAVVKDVASKIVLMVSKTTLFGDNR
jgi:V/A-type H+-transporting ATPase subunit G/H